MNRLERASEIFREEGCIQLIKRSFVHGYNTVVRPFIPIRHYPTYNGVSIGDRETRWFDGVVTWETPRGEDIPDYEEPAVNVLRRYTDEGDKVVIVGAGKGVTAVIAAEEVGPNGHVTAYEGSDYWVGVAMKTVELNGVDEWTEVHHTVVAENISVYGSAEGAQTLDPVDLPECDVMELDCEGAGIPILKSMSIRPRMLTIRAKSNHSQ
jgi:hypothetical protein